MPARYTILVVGGYGVFGGRLVGLLRDEERLTLLVAGRSKDKARALCATLDGRATLVPTAFDRAGDLATQIAVLQPALVVDASGPFQAYGDRPYRLIEACIDQGVSYLDLADGSDFVHGVRAFDAAARAKGVFVLSGVSSCPVLTAAVVRRLATDMARVDEIVGGIAPTPYAGVGENVVRAIAVYAGGPVALRRDGAWTTAHGFTEQRRTTIAPPGRLPLHSTLFSLVDVPDLRALPELWPEVRQMWMGAGPVPEILHRALILLSRLRRTGLLPAITPLAPLMQAAINRLRWGEHRGGMVVAVRGADRVGLPIARAWHLVAEGDDGPLIPSMGVEAVIRRLLRGAPPTPGARAATGDLELADYEALFARRAIHTGIRAADPPGPGVPLYARILGAAWDDLPPEIRSMHDLAGTKTVRGVATVTRSRNILAATVAALVGFPPAGVDIPVEVRFDVAGGVETWTRRFGAQRFGTRRFCSTQRAGTGRAEHLVRESFGPCDFDLALVLEERRLRLVLRRWSILGCPLPLWLAPRADAHETVQDGRFRFHVALRHPWLGLIVRYEGWLA